MPIGLERCITRESRTGWAKREVAEARTQQPAGIGNGFNPSPAGCCCVNKARWISVLALAVEPAPFRPAGAAGRLEQAAAKLQHRLHRPVRPIALPWSPIPAVVGTAVKARNTAADVAGNDPTEASCLPHWFDSLSSWPKPNRDRPNPDTATGALSS